MSGRMVGQVVDFFPARTKKYTLMLSLANRAADDGTGIRFDMERIAREARMSQRHAETFLAELIREGWVRYHEDTHTLSLHIAHTQKVTKATWLPPRRSSGKKVPRCLLTAATSGKHKNLENFDGILPLFSKLAVSTLARMGLFLENDGGNSEMDFQEKQLNTCAGRPFGVPYVLIRPLKDVVIPIVIDDAREPARDNNQTAAPEQAEASSTVPAWWDAAGAAALDAWTGPMAESQDSQTEPAPGLVSQPDGCAPGGAEALQDDFEGIDDLLDGKFDAQPTPPEKVPLAARAACAPDSDVRRKLTALCGGPNTAPFLDGLLPERTRGGQDRRMWLRLDLDELEQARQQAQRRLRAGEVTNFNSGIIEALDELVDGYRAGGPAPERAADLRRPGKDGPKPLPFKAGDRVMRGGQLGVVASAVSDARQAVVTVDFDDGDRLALTGPQAAHELHAAPTAPPPPAPVSPYPVGSRWRLASGQVLSVVSYVLGRPTTDDGTHWPAFGSGALARMAEQLPEDRVEAAS